MKHVLLSLVLIATLVGCNGPHDDVTMKKTEINFSHPETIGTLPDGRVIKCVTRSMGDLERDHTIYFVDSTITVNTIISSGKSNTRHVNVLIDGVMYEPKPLAEKP